MDSFDKILNEAKKIANLAVDKTEELARAGKAKLDIKQTEYEIKRLYEKIGMACYKAVKNEEDNSADIKELIEKIDELNDKIKEISEDNL